MQVMSSDLSGFKSTDQTFLETQLRILGSEFLHRNAVNYLLAAVAGEVSKEPGTRKLLNGQDLTGGEIVPPKSMPALKSFVSGKTTDQLRAELSRRFTANYVPRTRIFALQAKSSNPQFAAAAINAVGVVYGEYIAEMYASTAESAFLLLKQQAEETSIRVKALADKLVGFKEQTELDAILNPALIEELSAERLGQLRQELALRSSEITALEDQLESTTREINALSGRYRPMHPELKPKLAKQEFLRDQIVKLKDRILADWLREHQSERMTIEESFIEKDLETTRTLNELILSKMKEIDFSKAAPEVTVRFLRVAEVNKRQSSPNPFLNLTLGTLSGVVLGLVVTFGRAHGRSKIVTIVTPETDLPAPIVGRLPNIARKADLRALALGEDHSSPNAEAYKVLRTRVEALSRPVSNVILISSPERADGKSTISCSLAQTFAALGRRVLLMDVDLRCGSLHSILEQSQTPGLSELLKNSEDPKVIEINSCLDYLPCGQFLKNPSEMLASDRMEKIMIAMSQAYNVVIMDAPPLLPVADATLLARYSDIRIVVVRSGRTHLQAARMAANSLVNLGYDISGVVLNDVRLDEARQYDFGRYYYPQYGYGYDSK